jgi:hypothetical protein
MDQLIKMQMFWLLHALKYKERYALDVLNLATATLAS